MSEESKQGAPGGAVPVCETCGRGDQGMATFGSARCRCGAYGLPILQQNGPPIWLIDNRTGEGKVHGPWTCEAPPVTGATFIADAAPAALKAELESCRSRLSTAEKARDEALKDLEYERIHQRVAYKKVVAEAETAELALEKALGALRAALDYVVPHPRTALEMRDAVADGARLVRYDIMLARAREALSGGAHVDVPKAPKES